MATGAQVIAGQETILPKQNETGGVEQAGRSELMLRRSCSSSTNRQHSSFNNGSCYHYPSRSMDFSQQEGGYCSLLTELGSTRGAYPDPSIYTCNRRRTKATGGGHVHWRWRWPRLRTGVSRRKRPLPELVGRRQTADESCQIPEEQKSAAVAMQLQDDDNQFFGSDDETDCSKADNLILNRGMTRNSSMVEHRHGNHPGLSHEHQPKVFEDIIGHEMIIKALSNAIQSMRISPLYLFYGPGGTGKTSAAKIFGMALNCDSSSPSKPCWGCIGCSRSLYTADLCSGNRTAGFAHIKTLLQSTGFKQTFPGIKVFIIDECHTLSDDSWGELLAMTEQDKGCGSLVFIMIAEDVNMVPRAVSSRCQKFSFTKLKDTDIVLKLARIVSQEGIEIRNDALRLIAKKVEGDLREAENLLDQLALLGQTITASMVQQLVGLVPHEKLIHLLEAALCGDSIEALRSSKDLMAYYIEPRALVLQLASLITEILPSTSSSQIATSQDKSSAQGPILLRNIQPKRVYQALKILIETEKQLRMTSSNHATWVTAALLQIASDDNSNHSSTSIVLPKDAYTSDNKSDAASRIDSIDINRPKPFNQIDSSYTRHHHSNQSIAEQPSSHTDSLNTIIKSMDIEEVWRNILERLQNKSMVKFLHRQAKLISLTVSRANAIVHLMFMHLEKKTEVEMSKESISNALKDALGFPVTVNISHEPMQLEVVPRNYIVSHGKQVPEPNNSGLHKTQLLATSKPSSSLDGRLLLERSGSQKSAFYLGSNWRSTQLQNSGFISVQRNEHVCREHGDSIPEHIPVHSSQLTQGSKESTLRHPEMDLSGRDQSIDKTTIAGATELKPRLQPMSSIPRTDASIEPYSQDLMFDAANTDKKRTSRNSKFSNEVSKPNHYSHSMISMELNRSWSCRERFCRGDTVARKNSYRRHK